MHVDFVYVLDFLVWGGLGVETWPGLWERRRKGELFKYDVGEMKKIAGVFFSLYLG